jgi:ribosomal protein S18 acetylase RimI-like enzyme
MGMIVYKDTKDFKAEDLADLFLSVGWSSGHYPEKLAEAMKNSGAVFSAWDGGKLVGLAQALDDGVMTAYSHWILVNPEYQGKGIGKELVSMLKEKYKDYLRLVLIAYDNQIGFYENSGLKTTENKTPMEITELWT